MSEREKLLHDVEHSRTAVVETEQTTITHVSVGLYRRGDRLHVNGVPCVVTDVKPTTITLRWRDAWYWRLLDYIAADWARTVDEFVRLGMWSVEHPVSSFVAAIGLGAFVRVLFDVLR